MSGKGLRAGSDEDHRRGSLRTVQLTRDSVIHSSILRWSEDSRKDVESRMSRDSQLQCNAAGASRTQQQGLTCVGSCHTLLLKQNVGGEDQIHYQPGVTGWVLVMDKKKETILGTYYIISRRKRAPLTYKK